MDRIHSQSAYPLGNVRHAAIGITGDGSQRHTGVLHSDAEAAAVVLLDLAWHQRLRNQPPNNDYIWIDPAIPTPRLRQVAAKCRQVWRSNQAGIPYAFSTPNECFDNDTGEFLLGPTRNGLTCATFVLAVFHAAGLKLAQYETWPPANEDNRVWQNSIIEKLQETNPPAPIEHMTAIKSEVGAARFKPEEVAGAATISPLPASFDDASNRASLVLRKLDEDRA